MSDLSMFASARKILFCLKYLLTFEDNFSIFSVFFNLRYTVDEQGNGTYAKNQDSNSLYYKFHYVEWNPLWILNPLVYLFGSKALHILFLFCDTRTYACIVYIYIFILYCTESNTVCIPCIWGLSRLPI